MLWLEECFFGMEGVVTKPMEKPRAIRAHDY